MFTNAAHISQPENVIRFRSKDSTFVLPNNPTDEELAFDWTLSEEDKTQILAHRGDDNRRRYAVQLCVLRKYGRFLNNYKCVSTKAIGYLSHQLELEPVMALPSPAREATELEYRGDIQKYLKYSQFEPQAKDMLEKWISGIVSESFYTDNLFGKTESFLKKKRIILPSIKRLERIVNSAYAKAEQKIFEILATRISPQMRKKIDNSLQRNTENQKTPLFMFSEYPPEAKAKKIAEYFQNYTDIVAIGIAREIFTNIHPSLIKEMASAVKTYDAWRVKRFDETKRYALCACYLFETQCSILDNLVYMHSYFVVNMGREAKNLYEKKHRQLRKKLRSSIPVLEAFATKALKIENGQPIDPVYSEIDKKSVIYAIEDSRSFRTLEEKGFLQILNKKHPNFKRYFPMFLTLGFCAEKGASYLIEAIEIARKFNSGSLENIPDSAPKQFIPKRWQKMLYMEDGKINTRTWELGLAFAIRDALKSGDLFLPESRHHASFWELVNNTQDLNPKTDQVIALEPNLLTSLVDEFHQTAQSAVSGVENNVFINIKNGNVRFRRDEAQDQIPEVKTLSQLIESSMPKIRIEHLLMEIDALCGFTSELKSVDGQHVNAKRHNTLMAAIVAHATNLGVFTMAESTTRITVDMLRNISKSCLRLNTLKAANTRLVNYQKSLESSSIWGKGDSSSSDGQRFGVSKSSLISSMYPKYFGYYDKAVTVYTHISDQYSVFSTQVISCGDREAMYVLDGLLENDSDLLISSHYTDTGGYTDHIFALCFLLGFSFMPRLKNLHKRRLYKIDKNIHYRQLEPLFKGVINMDLIHEQLEPIHRLVSCIKSKAVPAHIIVQRLTNSSPADRLSKAIRELGRLVKTVYILGYIQDETIRRVVQKQLNRGEHRQAVAKHIFFAKQGEFGTGDLKAMMNKASCLSLLSNAILIWNTIQISRIVNSLRKGGTIIADEHLTGVSPMLHRHVIVNGTYDFS